MKKYKIRYQDGNEIKEIIVKTDNISKNELPKNILSIKEQINFDINEYLDTKRVSQKEVNLIFYELDLMLSSGLNLNDSINILIKNKKSSNIKEFLSILKDSLLNQNDCKDNLKKFNVSYLIPAFLDLSSKKGNIELNIKALNILLNSSYESKKEFIKSIQYPIILLCSFILSMLCIFFIVVPKFKVMFEENETTLPFATKSLLFLHHIFDNYLMIVFFLVFFLIVGVFYLYKKSKKIQYLLDRFLIKKFFIFKEVFLYFEAYKIFLIIDVMQKSGYEFHKALSASKVLLKNQYLLDKISLIESLLQNGKTISYSFSKTQLFDDMILNLINTAEVSNSLPKTVEEIKKIYKKRFDEKVKLIKTLVEPVFLVTMMSLIIWIVLAVFMPIWDMGNMLKN